MVRDSAHLHAACATHNEKTLFLIKARSGSTTGVGRRVALKMSIQQSQAGPDRRMVLARWG
jgi:hypothetical protein